MKVKKFYLKELEGTILLYIGPSDMFNKLSEEYDNGKDFADCEGICLTKKKTVLVGLFTDVIKRSNADIQLALIHELVHAIHYLFDYCQVDMEYANTEVVAYYISFYINEALKFLKKIKDG